jgi:hypothetical protein
MFRDSWILSHVKMKMIKILWTEYQIIEIFSNVDFILINLIYSENDFLISDKKQAENKYNWVLNFLNEKYTFLSKYLSFVINFIKLFFYLIFYRF